MALPSTGSLAMSQVNTELKKTGTINLGRDDVRKLAGVEQGTIKMSNLYGKSSATWVKVGVAEGNYRGGSHGNAVNEALENLRDDIWQKYNVNIYIDEIGVGKIFYSEDRLAKAVLTKSNAYPAPGASGYQAEIEAEVWKFQ